MIKTNSLEIFKQNHYIQTEIGNVSNNAYLSIVMTNKCQCKCSYCINSETDQSSELPIEKAFNNIKELVSKYGIKEAIILGGEPLMHPQILEFVKMLRLESGLEMVRLTTNGIKLKDTSFLEQLIHPEFGIQGLNISFHGKESFIPVQFYRLFAIYKDIKAINPNIKVRVNTNIWKGNLDKLDDLLYYLNHLVPSICDEVRLSNLIPKDDFSVNLINKNDYLGLTVEEYNNYFEEICNYFSENYSLIENEKTLGFVRYILIPTKTPIILNWNTSSSVAEQICENNIKTQEINTFKCLVNGEISLSWNEKNIL